eukprot:scaffold7936_cov116-Isochrysis_galbana.AAC.7
MTVARPPSVPQRRQSRREEPRAARGLSVDVSHRAPRRPLGQPSGQLGRPRCEFCGVAGGLAGGDKLNWPDHPAADQLLRHAHQRTALER